MPPIIADIGPYPAVVPAMSAMPVMPDMSGVAAMAAMAAMYAAIAASWSAIAAMPDSVSIPAMPDMSPISDTPDPAPIAAMADTSTPIAAIFAILSDIAGEIPVAPIRALPAMAPIRALPDIVPVRALPAHAAGMPPPAPCMPAIPLMSAHARGFPAMAPTRALPDGPMSSRLASDPPPPGPSRCAVPPVTPLAIICPGLASFGARSKVKVSPGAGWPPWQSLMCTKTSGLPPAIPMKPNPLSALNDFTTPVCDPVPSTGLTTGVFLFGTPPVFPSR
mmetsp:Transcript_28817/g.51480  ORF Transcript_28817/g.51480 Transcript_28817/m.51480 type:complete len:277 (-) Transcript_28817:282-1112(-)